MRTEEVLAGITIFELLAQHPLAVGGGFVKHGVLGVPDGHLGPGHAAINVVITWHHENSLGRAPRNHREPVQARFIIVCRQRVRAAEALQLQAVLKQAQKLIGFNELGAILAADVPR